MLSTSAARCCSSSSVGRASRAPRSRGSARDGARWPNSARCWRANGRSSPPRERALVAAAPQIPALQRAADRALAGEASRLFAGDSVGATAELTSYVADVATESEVRLTSVEARAPSAQSGVTRLLVDARGEGSWSEVLDFVAALESSEQLVDVTSVRVERGARPGAAGGSTVTVAVTVAGYARTAR